MGNRITPELSALLDHVRGKRVALMTHWDADGITSGAMLYHLIEPTARSVFTSSKGEVFLIEEQDFPPESEIIICSDIQPSSHLDPQKVIYIDHHPHPHPEQFLMTIHDPGAVSTSTLLWQRLIPDTTNPYFIFLALVGYFGDGGSKKTIPERLYDEAMAQLPDLMKKNASRYKKGDFYYEIEKYVSDLNTGKRMHWSGDLPLEMLKNIKHQDLYVNKVHPIANELAEYKLKLRSLYRMKVDLKDLRHIRYGVIASNRNIQGVLCARYMDDKPVMIMNRFNGKVIGSMRVPDNNAFDAGKFLDSFNGQIDSFLGGGHEKAGGFTVASDQLDSFLRLLDKNG
ncbi:MAG: hypothetical protein GXP63_04350 [DPANN group archaeon]|nr:hypothetical protein [DPANN group archaeon]